MANHPPVPPVVTLQYYVQLSALGQGLASVTPGAIEIIQFTFTPPGTYTGFDQDTAEAGITSMLNGMCAAWAAITGLTQAAVQAAVVVNRVWTFSAPAGITWSDVMKYP
jgi:hypothetical protein